ncbi:ABC1-domain-containing protein [Rickenella mellea]|uniref:ABC1-domain-containing protein n=1 Tax=Rickenella mellea TaxID=50990 RepID=A0A4Y7PIQ1_9AGAM|nr:ABC1-domain-containing protein [Rickenella mellea]
MPSNDPTTSRETSSPFLLELGGPGSADSELHSAIQEGKRSPPPFSSYNKPTAEADTPTPVLPITESVSVTLNHLHTIFCNFGLQVVEDFTPLSDPQRTLQASRVPSSRIGRLFHYGGLAASLGYGAATEVLRRSRAGDAEQASSSLIMTPSNVSRLVSKLSRMRGAALKLGQFMSIQDSHILPKDVEEIFRRVQDSAHYMPNWQMERVMSGAFGQSWRDNFVSFDPIPFAAASLGQVHRGALSSSVSPTGNDEEVAVKVQFPDIARSLDSDLGYMKMLLTAGSLLPRGLFLDRTIKVMKEELKDECDYVREASFIRAFASNDRLGHDSRFCIPWVWEGSTKTVLVMKHMEGVSVGGGVVDTLSKEDRNTIASGIIELCMKELFEFRMMQTDPNWTNFLWNRTTRQIALIDFGATREYSKCFIDKWMHLLQAAVSEDREACILWSRELGYLTGEENDIMVDAHVRSLILLGHPFRAYSGHPVAFGPGTEYAGITGEIRSLIPVMLSHRLTPPPRETYSLNRKLSGAFLLASRLSASVDCRTIWDEVVRKYQFDA